MARKLRQVVDLYTTGKPVVLRDGTAVWVQPLNPFEADTARNEAQVAKTRLSMAIRQYGSQEQEQVRAYFLADGLDDARVRLVEAKVAERTPRIFEGVRNDPDWTERLAIMDRGADEVGALEQEEQELLLAITNDYAAELGKRIENERQFHVETFAEMDEAALWEAYLTWFIDRRCAERMMNEFHAYQILYGVRWCEGSQSDGRWDHAACNGHDDQVFATIDEVRRAPEALLELLVEACDDIDMTAREAKNSDRQGSSSDSSPLPSEAAESTASTPDETPVAPPGSSASPSATPSPSLAGAS